MKSQLIRNCMTGSQNFNFTAKCMSNQEYKRDERCHTLGSIKILPVIRATSKKTQKTKTGKGKKLGLICDRYIVRKYGRFAFLWEFSPF